MRGTLIVGILVVLAVLVPVGAQQSKPGEYYGLGTQSCGAWLEARTNDHNVANLSWVMGFVSGVGWTGQRLKNTDYLGMQAFVDQYCDAHPLDDIAVAAAELVQELTVKTP